MPKQTKRLLSRDHRLAQGQQIRERAGRFLAELPELVRRHVLHEPLTLDEHKDYWLGPAEFRNQVTVARHQYEAIIVHDPLVWRQYCRKQIPGYKLIAEYTLLGRVPRRGAPTRRPEEREGFFIGECVNEAMKRLRQGCELRRRLKSLGGGASDDAEIRPKLMALGYGPEEITAILKTKQPLSAAIFLIARQTGKKPSAIRSSLGRSRRL